MAQALAQPTAQALGQAARAESKPLSLAVAERLYRAIGGIKFMNQDVRKLGLSLEDWAARFLTVFSVYIPQGYLAIKEDKHKWETNGRNVVVWWMTFGLTALMKNDKFSVNSWLNRFMAPNTAHEKLCFDLEATQAQVKQIQGRVRDLKAKDGPIARLRLKRQEAGLLRAEQALGKLTAQFDKLLDVARSAGMPLREAADAPMMKRLEDLYAAADKAGKPIRDLPGNASTKLARLRMNGNYFELLRKVGLGVSGQNTAVWSSMDLNNCDKLVEALEDKARADHLSPVEKNLLKLGRQMVRRASGFRILSTAAITAATVYVIGGLAMKIVYKFIAPFDHDFIPPEKKNKPAPSQAPSPLPGVAPPLGASPSAAPLRRAGFEAFATARPTGGAP